MTPAHILLLLLGTLALRRSAAAQSIGNDTNGSAGTHMPGRRQLQLQEVTYTFGISMSAEKDPVGDGMDCFYCPDALAGLNYWKSEVNTNLVTDPSGRKVFVEFHKMDDHGNVNLVQQNYEELASNERIFALFGPSWVGFNDVAAAAAKKYDKVLITWAFDPFNYYSTPGPVLSTADLPAGGPVYAQDKRRLRGECTDDSCHVDEVPRGMSSPNKNTISDDKLAVIPERTNDPFARRLQLGPSWRGLPCKEREYMRYPFYPSCEAAPARGTPPYAWHTVNRPHSWTTVMMIPAGLSEMVLSMLVSIERSSTPISEFVALQVVSLKTGECIFGLSTNPMIRNPGGCSQLEECEPPSAGSLRRDSCVNLGNGSRASVYIDLAEYEAGKQMMHFVITEKVERVDNIPVPEDMLLMIMNERPATFNFTMAHGSVANCEPSTLAANSGCTPCHEYECPAKGNHQQYPMCFGYQIVECTIWPHPDGFMWEKGYPNIVDINVPETRWAYDAIDRILLAGVENLVFFYSQESATPPSRPDFGTVSWQRQCSQLREYAEGRSGSKFDVVEFKLQPRLNSSDYVMQMRRFALAWQDHGMIICAELPSVIEIVLSLKTFSLIPEIIVADRPLGVSLVQAVHGFNAINIAEALPMTYKKSQKCMIYEDFTRFEERYSYFTPSEGFLSYAALQTATAGSILVHAISMLPHDHLTANETMNFLKTSTIETCMGEMRFDETGRRNVERGGTRQIKPLPESVHELVRYYQASIPVLDDDLAATCSSEPCAYDTLEYSVMSSWYTKLVNVYPCDPGCELKGQMCLPCPAGKFRQYNDPECRSCPKGKFASIPGRDVCQDCMEGAYCENPTVLPLPKANYDRLAFSGNVSEEDDANWSMIPGAQCVNPYRFEPVVFMFACTPITVCTGMPLVEHRGALMENELGQRVISKAEESGYETQSICTGSNKGPLCGQCEKGSTISPLVGMRKCHPCPSRFVPFILVSLTTILFVCFAKILTTSSYRSARQVSLVTPMLRLMIHHIHAWGSISEASHMDADPIAAVLMAPIDFFCRPHSLSMIECLRTEVDEERSLRDAIHFGKWLYFVVASILILLHVLRYFFASIIAACWALFQYARRAGRGVIQLHSDIVQTATPVIQYLNDDQTQLEKCSNCGNFLDKGEKFCRACGTVNSEDAADNPDDDKDKEEDEEKGKQVAGDDKVNDAVVTQMDEDTSKPILNELDADERWSRVYGPGATFAMSHGHQVRMKIFRNYLRELLVLLLFLFPITLHIFVQGTTCRTLSAFEKQSQQTYTEERLKVNYDIVCGSEMHKSITAQSEILGIVLVIAVPLLVGLISCFYAWMRWLDSVLHREIAVILFDGFKPDRVFWSAVMWFRTGLVIYCGMIEEPVSRRVAAFCVVAAVFVLAVTIQPWENLCRNSLPNYDMYSAIAIMLLAVAGVQSPYELDAGGRADFFELSFSVKRAIIITAVLINYCVLIYGFMLLFFFTVLTKLFTVIQHSETDVDRAANYVYKFARWIYGLNGVAHMTKNGQQIICVSRLSEGERQFIVQSIAETVNACIDSSAKFYTWLLENAIKKAFERAVEARHMKLGILYATWGTRTFALIDIFGIFRWLRVTLRPPDVQADVSGVKEVEWTIAGPKWWKMEMSRTPEHWRSAVTVQELHDALTSVSYDVMEHHPELLRDPRGYSFVKPEEIARRQEEQHKLQVHVPVWHQATDLQGFEGELREQGLIDTSPRALELDYAPDEDLWQQMENDTQEFKETNVVATEIELENELSTLEDRILELRKQLEEAGDTAALSLEKDEDDGKTSSVSSDSLAELVDQTDVREASLAVDNITVTVISGKDLHDSDIGNKSDPYCLVSLRNRPESKWRTRTIRNTLNPVWNQTREMRNVTRADRLDFVVMDDDSAKFKRIVKDKDDFMGHAFISCKAFWAEGFTGNLTVENSQGESWGEIRVAIAVNTKEKVRAKDAEAMTYFEVSRHRMKAEQATTNV